MPGMHYTQRTFITEFIENKETLQSWLPSRRCSFQTSPRPGSRNPYICKSAAAAGERQNNCLCALLCISNLNSTSFILIYDSNE